jgi:hypothetical protein
MQRTLVLSLALSLLVFSSRSVSAQITQQRGPAARTASASGAGPVVSKAAGPNYSVTFDADALDATLEDGTIPRIVCRPVKGFGELTRPRTHFVPELLKSVELM